jgi:hypothetical protein
MWSKQNGVDEDELLDSLPDKLRTEVALYINEDLLKTVHFFKNAKQGFINELGLRFSTFKLKIFSKILES